jgi:HPt (histidine-containing phosphotransfer) domain-containing protein
MESTNVIDLTYLKEASANNKVFLKEMIGIFLDQTPGLITSLHASAKTQDWTEFRRIMHKVKPTITMMGIHKLDADIEKIDNAVKNGIGVEELPSLLQRFETLCNKSYTELRTELKSL